MLYRCVHMSDLDQRLVLRLNASELQELRQLAAKDHRSVSAMVRVLIAEATQREEQQ